MGVQALRNLKGSILLQDASEGPLGAPSFWGSSESQCGIYHMSVPEVAVARCKIPEDFDIGSCPEHIYVEFPAQRRLLIIKLSKPLFSGRFEGRARKVAAIQATGGSTTGEQSCKRQSEREGGPS